MEREGVGVKRVLNLMSRNRNENIGRELLRSVEVNRILTYARSLANNYSRSVTMYIALLSTLDRSSPLQSKYNSQ